MLDAEDHIQNARIAVARAVDAWDGRGHLGAYTYQAAVHAVIHGMRDAAPFPDRVYRNWRLYQRTAAGVGDDVAAVAAALNITPDEAEAYRAGPPPPPLSLDSPGPDGESPLGHLLPSDQRADAYLDGAMDPRLTTAIGRLTERERRVILAIDVEGRKRGDVARAEGVSVEYVRRVRLRGLRKLQAMLAEEIGADGNLREA